MLLPDSKWTDSNRGRQPVRYGLGRDRTLVHDSFRGVKTGPACVR
jgi:hypothetical protein